MVCQCRIAFLKLLRHWLLQPPRSSDCHRLALRRVQLVLVAMAGVVCSVLQRTLWYYQSDTQYTSLAATWVLILDVLYRMSCITPARSTSAAYTAPLVRPLAVGD